LNLQEHLALAAGRTGSEYRSQQARREAKAKSMDMKRHNRNGHGFSLVEVLVAMVLLLIGIFAVARLFPGGFLSIIRTGDAGNANALAHAQLAALDQMPEPPQGVYAVIPDALGNLTPDPTALPDDLTQYSSANLPAGVLPGSDPYDYSNINRIRYVKGEAIRLPIGTPNAATGIYGAPYALQFGPISNIMTGAAGARSSSVRVYGTNLTRVIQSSVPSPDQPDATPQLNGDTQYAIDYQNLKVAFFPRVGSGQRVYLFRYAYKTTDASGTQFKTVLNAQYTINDVPASNNVKPIWHALFFDPTDSAVTGLPLPADAVTPALITVGSDAVNRAFRLVSKGTDGANYDTFIGTGVAPAWSADPYEYAILSQQYANNGNAGVLVFNPIARNTVIAGANGSQPLTARADYLIFDNHILRQDLTIPTYSPYEVKLAVKAVLTSGDILADQNRYGGMYRDPANNDTPAVVIVNTATGEEIQPFIGACVDGLGQGRGYTLDARNGSIRFDDDYVKTHNLQTSNIRVYYRAAKDFGLQLQKAFSAYTPSQDPTDLKTDGSRCYVGGAGGGLPTRIYFSRSEAGKSVVLGDYHVTATGGQLLHYSSETYRISGPEAFDPALGLPFVDIRDQHPEAVANGWQLSTTETGFAVSNVRGVSVKSRVIWQDSSNVTQDASGAYTVNYRWRRSDADTLLK